MKKLIVYGSKNGSTKKTAELLAEKIGGAEVVDLKENTPDPSDYDLIVIGGCIRMGQYPRVVKKYIKKQVNKLLDKKVIYYINCGFVENKHTYFENNIPENLRNRTLGLYAFGGELDIARLTGADRMVATAVTKQSDGSGRPPVKIDLTAIEQCAKRIQAAEALEQEISSPE